MVMYASLQSHGSYVEMLNIFGSSEK